MIEALPARPAVERTGDAGLPIGDVVVLANECRAVAVLPQYLRNHSSTCRDLTAVTGVGVAQLGDSAGTCGVMIAAGEQCRSRRRTESRCVKARVAEPACRHAVEIGRRDQPPKSTPLAEAGVVDEDDKDIRCASGAFTSGILSGLESLYV